MCINPVLLPNGQEVACHQCWQCVRRKVDDWTGRCIAEGQTAAGVTSVTLTYGRDKRYNASDHVRAAVLTYSDVQRYFRAWRDAEPVGWPLRYFVVGEYGSKKGRAHWHALVFWKERVPMRPLGIQFIDPHWPHGFSFWDDAGATPAAVKYVTKYIAKEVETEERQYHVGMSKYPPLGADYFESLAHTYVSQGIAPKDFFYDFEFVRDRHGRRVRYQMQGRTRELFLSAYCRKWGEIWGDRHMPNSDLVEEFLDREAVKGSPEEAQRIVAAEKVGVAKLEDTVPKDSFAGVVKKPTLDDLRSWMDPERLVFSETLNVWMYQFDGDQRPWYWARSPEGVYGWRSKIGDGPQVPKPNTYLRRRRG